MYIGLHVKYPFSLSDFNETWIFLTDFQKVLKYQISWNWSWVVPCGWTDRQTHMMKIWVTFCNFANAYNKDIRWNRCLPLSCVTDFESYMEVLKTEACIDYFTLLIYSSAAVQNKWQSSIIRTLITYLPTPWSRVPLEMLTSFQLHHTNFNFRQGLCCI
jgi:hypothetical protein